MKPLWTPSPERVARTSLARFMKLAGKKSYDELHAWSIAESEAFWNLLWDFCAVRGTRKGPTLVRKNEMPGAQWFPEARLNFADNLLRSRNDTDALVFWGEDRIRKRFSHNELQQLVSRLAQALQAAGVKKGDRVAGYLPNLPESIAATLATASLGAIWSSCSPDFGVQGVLDRFGQIEPKVLFCADGYLYGGKQYETQDKVKEILAKLPSVKACVVLPYLNLPVSAGVGLEDFIKGFSSKEIHFEQVEFNHPLYILYSSGTTGVPKCIVHGTGGTLLQHLKEHQLQSDVRQGDRLFYFTTLGWMMWNWLVSGLASGATLLLYDGSPTVARGRILFDFADAEGMTHLGTSAKFIDSLIKLKVRPKETHRLEKLRAILSTGSPLLPESFDYVYEKIKQDVCLSSISGGTDIVSCFVLGNPTGPVWSGEIQAKGLGMAVEVFDESGRSLERQKGELVCTRPFPSMPVGFWNDPDGAKYHAAYFERYPNVWRHGDWTEITEHGGIIIYGRSDTVLNPGGVRIGTAEIYRQVEQLEEVLESLVIGQDWEGDVRVVLFVKLKEGLSMDDSLAGRIRQKIKINTTPRHVPAKILQVADIPRTKSGKIVELAVRNVVHGQPVKNIEALANPEALEQFRDRGELRHVTALPSSRPFSDLDEAALRGLVPGGALRSYGKNVVVVSEGDLTDSLYVVLSGRVKAFIADESGREVVVNTIEKGDYFGELVLDGGPRAASVMTLEPSRLYVIPQAEVERLLEANPEFARDLLRRLIGKVRSLTGRVADLVLKDVYARLVKFIAENAVAAEGRRVVPERLTQNDIAARIGASREMVSRILKDLAAGGYVAVETKHIVILRDLPARW